jgi:hypothetical protein
MPPASRFRERLQGARRPQAGSERCPRREARRPAEPRSGKPERAGGRRAATTVRAVRSARRRAPGLPGALAGSRPEALQRRTRLRETPTRYSADPRRPGPPAAAIPASRQSRMESEPGRRAPEEEARPAPESPSDRVWTEPASPPRRAAVRCWAPRPVAPAGGGRAAAMSVPSPWVAEPRTGLGVAGRR